MRVLVLTPTFLPMVGGAEILLLEVYRRLAERHEICLLTVDKGLPPSDLDHLINFPVTRFRDRFSSMNYRGHRVTGGFVPPFSLSAVAAVRDLIPGFRPDVVNTHYVAHTGLATVVAQRNYGIPSVLTFSGRDVPGPRTPWFWKYYDRWVAGSVAKVTLISEYCRRAIFGPTATVGTIIPAGVDLARFKPELGGSHIRERLGISVCSPVILAVQRLAPEKRVDVLVRCMPRVLRKHPSAVLVIGGKGPAMPLLDQLVQQLDLEGSVRLAGYIAYPDLPGFYAMADAYAFHSTYETFGIVIAQAMASGKPVVSVRSTAIPEVVQDGYTGLLAEPLDPADLADKIVYLLDSPVRMREFGRNGRRWAEEHFDWDDIADQYERELMEAAGL
jgi:phosphatidylinositol alpha-1,6-mannosyltransferase